MVEVLVAIVCGVLLIATGVRGRPGIRRTTGRVGTIKAVIGIVALVAGLLSINRVLGLLLVLAGWVLAAPELARIPTVGPHLGRAGRFLGAFRVAIGILVITAAVVTLL